MIGDREAGDGFVDVVEARGLAAGMTVAIGGQAGDAETHTVAAFRRGPVAGSSSTSAARWHTTGLTAPPSLAIG